MSLCSRVVTQCSEPALQLTAFGFCQRPGFRLCPFRRAPMRCLLFVLLRGLGDDGLLTYANPVSSV